MAKQTTLTQIGLTLGLIGGVLAIVDSVLIYMSANPVIPNSGQFYGIQLETDLLINTLVRIVIAVLLIAVCNNRVDIRNSIALGIIIIVLGLLVGYLGGVLAILGGIFIIIDDLL